MHRQTKMAGIAAAEFTSSPDLPAGLSISLLNCVDMSTLSQSELRAISSSRNEPLEVAASSAIDRFSFNESYGSRRQTYSRLSPSHHHHRHHRLAAPLPKTHPNQPSAPNPGPDFPPFNSELELDRLDCRAILDSLKHILSSNPDFQLSEASDLNYVNDIYNNETYQGPGNVDETEPKPRKRGRKPRVPDTDWGSNTVALLNKNKVMIDLDALESMNDPFAEELGRRTSKMGGENELLSFFAALNGEWCSRRKRRKIVDADGFGDALPLGWKLLLGLRRKEGRAWVYCRRYVSPDGQHFATCKDAAKYLRSLTISYEGHREKDYIDDNLWHVGLESSGMHADEHFMYPKLPEIDMSMLNLENLVDVEVRDLFECFRCNILFQEKDSYLNHLLAAHQRHIRKPRGNSVGEGVIIKDGKFECQFCHKVFEEKRRYFSHVGIHVRNYVRGVEDAPGIQMALEDAPVGVDFPATTSKMDALIQIAQNSIQTASCSSSMEKIFTNPISHGWNTSSRTELQAKLPSPISEWNHEHDMSGSSTDSEFEQDNDEEVGVSGKMLNLNDVCDVVDVMVEDDHDFGLTKMAHDKAEGIENRGLYQSASNMSSVLGKPCHLNVGQQLDFQISAANPNCSSSRSNKIQPAKVDSTFTGPVYQFPLFSSNIIKEPQREEPHDLNFPSENLPIAPSISFNACRLEEPCDTSIQFSLHNFVEAAVNKEELTSLCVWCGEEFVHETVDSELQSDSVGYMCLTCKAKTSGRI